jgi:LuxR family maltose regulon positive regulatory protein
MLRTVPISKLTIPQAMGVRMSRMPLVNRIERANQRLSLVVAPAGFGKTTVLAEWARTTTACIAWLSCDEACDGPWEFWSGVISTIVQQWPGVGDDAALILARGPQDLDGLVSSLVNDLDEIRMPFAIVIDDAQYAKSSQRSLVDLAQGLPLNGRMVLSSRWDPPFSLSKLRIDDNLFELRARDLVFSQEETVELFRSAQLTIDRSDVERLHAFVEGWPAGCHLALAALRRSDDQKKVLDVLSRSTRAVNDYLVSEVLERLEADLVDFMTEISVLDEFDLDLAKAVSGDPNAEHLFADLLSADLFVTEMDAIGERYRFHHLFSAFLRARLRSLGDARVRALDKRAIAALQLRGDRTAALGIAMASGDTRRAATIVTEAIVMSFDLSNAGDSHRAILAWLREYGTDSVSHDPETLLQLVLVLAISGSHDVENWLIQVELANPEADPFLRALLYGTWAANDLGRGDSERAIAHNELAIEASRITQRQHPALEALPVQRATAYLMNGDLAGAGGAIELGRYSLVYPIVDSVLVVAVRAWVAFLRGELNVAIGIAEQARKKADELDAPAHAMGRTMASLVDAGIALERGQLDTAEHLLIELEANARNSGPNPLLSFVLLWRARSALAQGEEEAAAVHLATARRLFSAPSSGVRANFALEELRLAIAFAPERGTALTSQLPARNESNVLQVRLMVAQGKSAIPAVLLDDTDPTLTSRERIEMGVLKALVESGQDMQLSQAMFQKTLLFARPEGFLRTILDQGTGVGQLLRSLPVGNTSDSYVQELIAMSDAAVAPKRHNAPGTLALSPREVTVLRYLASRLTQHEIADDLFVSMNTLKSHMRSLYRKLGVRSRVAAVENGQAAGLI